jgi:hypothetical protein
MMSTPTTKALCALSHILVNKLEKTVSLKFTHTRGETYVVFRLVENMQVYGMTSFPLIIPTLEKVSPLFHKFYQGHKQKRKGERCQQVFQKTRLEL